MDPITITAACVGLLSGLTTVSTKLRGLTTDAKNANKEITALQNELDSCQRSLGLFYGSGDADRYPEEMKADLEKIIRECRNVVAEIDRTLDKISSPSLGQSIQWSMTIRDEIARLHRNLEGHKSALSIAIAFASMSMNRGIKSDTSSIRSKAGRIPDMQNQLAAILQALQVSDEGPQKQELGMTMQRFLQDAYAQSVVDSSLTRSNTFRSYSAPSYVENPFRDRDTESIFQSENGKREPDEAYFSGSAGTASDVLSVGSLKHLHSKNSDFDQERSNSLPPLQNAKSEPVRRKPVPTQSFTSTRAHSLIPESDTISITDSQHPLASTNYRRRSMWKSWGASRSKPSITFEMPTLDGRISQQSLERTSTLLRTDPIKLSKSTSRNEFMSKVDSMYQRTINLAPVNNNSSEIDARFQQALARHKKDAADTDARREFKSLAELGHISSHAMYAAALRYGRGHRRDTKLALAYLYTAVRVSIDLELRHEGPWFTDTSQADELRFALFEIARTFMYPGDTLSAPDARAFYAAGADLGDWQGMYQYACCFLYGEGGEQNKEIGHLLIARAKSMRVQSEQVVKFDDGRKSGARDTWA